MPILFPQYYPILSGMSHHNIFALQWSLPSNVDGGWHSTIRIESRIESFLLLVINRSA